MSCYPWLPLPRPPTFQIILPVGYASLNMLNHCVPLSTLCQVQLRSAAHCCAALCKVIHPPSGSSVQAASYITYAAMKIISDNIIGKQMPSLCSGKRNVITKHILYTRWNSGDTGAGWYTPLGYFYSPALIRGEFLKT